jgi:hypothetical protein
VIWGQKPDTKTDVLDPFGVLEPDEVQIKSSYYNLKMPDGTNSNIVLGDVLVRTSLMPGAKYISLVILAYQEPLQASYRCQKGEYGFARA